MTNCTVYCMRKTIVYFAKNQAYHLLLCICWCGLGRACINVRWHLWWWLWRWRGSTGCRFFKEWCRFLEGCCVCRGLQFWEFFLQLTVVSLKSQHYHHVTHQNISHWHLLIMVSLPTVPCSAFNCQQLKTILFQSNKVFLSQKYQWKVYEQIMSHTKTGIRFNGQYSTTAQEQWLQKQRKHITHWDQQTKQLTLRARLLCAMLLPTLLSLLYDSRSVIHSSTCDRISFFFSQKCHCMTCINQSSKYY